MQIFLAHARGQCSGVRRAIRIVESALRRFGKPLYVRKEIVHNRHTVDRLKERGVLFVEELDQVPLGSPVVFSAHGVSPAVRRIAADRGLIAIDATCPLISQIHLEVIRRVRQGHHILLIGHEGHDEVVGVLGHAPGDITLVQNLAEAQTVSLPRAVTGENRPLSVFSQTTLSTDLVEEVIEALKERWPRLQRPGGHGACYATAERQNAVRDLCSKNKLDFFVVVGSPNSSNSCRLVDIPRKLGIEALLVDGPEDIDGSVLAGKESIGLSAGASSPESIVQQVSERLVALHDSSGSRRDIETPASPRDAASDTTAGNRS